MQPANISNRENYLRALRFDHPAHIPVSFYINPACYEAYDQDFLFGQMEAHPLLFPNFRRPKEPYRYAYGGNCSAEKEYVDSFGCVWRTAVNGLTGTVVGHPLSDWDAFSSYEFPSPQKSNGLSSVDWDRVGERIAAAKERALLTSGGLRHGHTFLQLSDLRGYENLLCDMADEEPRLLKLIERLEEFNQFIVEKYLSFDVDVICYPEDLGMQKGPMLSPEQFRRYIMPSYQRLMEPARKKGSIVHMHSDGDIRDLAEDLVAGGVEIINLQDLVNGIDWIRDRFRGKVCIELDIDRQHITPFGSPAEIDRLIRREVTELGGPEGGLMLVYGLYPGLPRENVKAVMDAMERYACFY